tara:strand:- start:71065 stop:72366 length:1302 start_codon:yes stop_codon:yes gene_type:complete
MDNDILKIASMLGEDPDDIKEMALTTGAIPAGPFGDAGFVNKKKSKANKKRSRKKKKSGSDNKEGSVLYSGIEDDKHIEEASRVKKQVAAPTRLMTPEERKAKKKQEVNLHLKQKAQHLSPSNIRRPNSIIFNGGIDVNPMEVPDSTEMQGINARVEKAESSLGESWKKLTNIFNALRHLEMYDGKIQIFDKNKCHFYRQYRILNDIYSSGHSAYEEAQNEWGGGISPGLSMLPPVKGWRGIHNWNKNALERSRYVKNYVRQIAYVYLKHIGENVLITHMGSCSKADCLKSNHAHFLIKGYCDGFKEDGQVWNMTRAVKKVFKIRQKALQDFAAKRRKKKEKPPAPTLSPGDQARYDEEIATHGRVRGGQMAYVFQDYYYDLIHKNDKDEMPEVGPETAAKQGQAQAPNPTQVDEWAPFDISGYLTEDPDLFI